jgi:hypothetical protein
MANTVVLKAAGLYTSPNQLSLPDGALSEASNVVIRRNGIIEQRRGFKLYGNSGGSTSDLFKQLTSYRGRIIRHITNQLEYDSDGVGSFQAFAGNFVEASDLLRMKFIESNGNLYFTSNNGIQKLSAKTANTIGSSTITPAGAAKAISIEGKSVYQANLTTGFLPQDSAVAYRVVWGYKDINDNLIQGSPSQRELVYNYQLNSMLQDYMNLLGTLDSFTNTPLTTARINDKNYVSSVGVISNSSTADLRAQMIALTTKLDNDILLANTSSAPLIMSSASITTGVCTITFSSGNPADYVQNASNIFLAGFTVATGDINGAQTVASITPTTLTFNTTASGAVTVTGSSINSNEFRSITQPPAVAIPPIHLDNLDVQAYFSNILAKLRALTDSIITTNDQLLLDTVDITTTSNVELTIAIPQSIDSRYFYQVYRSSIFSASDAISISDITPNDELQLVYEAYPTSAELSAGSVVVTDITPDDFKGANLYTNNSTGEGITQSNEVPPFATDINRYRNVVFYANTRTKHSLLFNLLGVQSMIADYDLGNIPSITIATAASSNTYTFVTGLQEITTVQTVADVANSLNNAYFLIYAATGKKFCVYLETTSATAPNLGTDYTYVKVNFSTGSSANTIATAIKDKLSVYLSDFTCSSLTNTVTVTNVNFGAVTDPIDGTIATGFTLTVTTQGRGENIANKQVLLSTNVSPAIAVDETARSFIRCINQNSNETIYGFYLSGAFDVPGKMQLEARDLQIESEFFMLANNSTTGLSFNPAISPTALINDISVAQQTVITTSTNHGLTNLDFVVISSTNSTPSIDGIYEITYISPTTFSIDVEVTVAGTTGSMISSIDSITSENEVKSNRVYYSKLYQPEAVPSTNYFNVGAEDKAILRIFPLRDSLFVFKEDGLYRISGDSAPFQLNLFDSSFNVTAPDSVTVVNNVIFAWTTQGIQSLTEGGAQVISRAIDDQILKLGSVNYLHFKTATLAVGYESDNSYLVFTVKNFEDTVATKAYRFSTLTQSWTTYDKTNTCAIVNPIDDVLYLGAGDTNYLEKERKLFDRTDYADRELSSAFGNNFLVSPNIVKLSSILGYEPGDVLLQTQTVNIFDFNTFMDKLSRDSGINDPTYNTLAMVNGDNPRNKILALAKKLDLNANITVNDFEARIDDYVGTITDISGANPSIITSTGHNLITGRYIEITGSNSSPNINGVHKVTVIDANRFSIPVSVKIPGNAGSWQTDGQNFNDIRVCYNDIVSRLNSDTGVSFNNYRLNSLTTDMEAIIIEVDPIKRQLTLNVDLNFLVGEITIFKSIKSSVTYAPITMGDPLMLKHLREATLMLETRNITNAVMAFGTDLLPELIPVPFTMDGNGIFGHNTFGSGFFGGSSNSAPFRTFIPRQCQRCRFIVVNFQHNVAREDYRLLGATITGETQQSTRAYR